jgi:hypothetical protein
MAADTIVRGPESVQTQTIFVSLQCPDLRHVAMRGFLNIHPPAHTEFQQELALTLGVPSQAVTVTTSVLTAAISLPRSRST